MKNYTDHQFSLQGFTLVEEKDTGSHLVNIGRVGNFILEMIISKKALEFGDFLVAKASDLNGRTIWTFKEEAKGEMSRLLGRLVWSQDLRDHFILILQNNGPNRNKTIKRVIRLVDLGAKNVVLPSIERRIEIKKILADELGYAIEFSDNERLLNDYVKQQAIKKVEERRAAEIAKAAAEKAAAEKIAAEKIAAREAKRLRKAELKREQKAKIMARAKIDAFSSEGSHRSGLPVWGEEWKCLDDGTHVISMGDDGSPQEYFIVKKTAGGKTGKDRLIEVFTQSDQKYAASENCADALGADVMGREKKLFLPIKDGKAVQEAIVVTKEEFKQLSGLLNSGTHVAVQEDSEDRYTVYQMNGPAGNVTVGGFKII